MKMMMMMEAFKLGWWGFEESIVRGEEDILESRCLRKKRTTKMRL